MIGRLSGRLAYRAGDHVMIEVGGVGYLVHCSDRTMAALPGPGAPVALYTDLLVREDLLQLYGFASLIEKEWHRLLTTVQGVGAKASLAILGALGPEGIGRAVALGDWAALRSAKGVGPKLAQRIVSELKDKAPAVMAMGGSLEAAMQGDPAVVEDAAPAAPAAPAAAAPSPAKAPSGAAALQADALSALSNLGYAPGEAAGAVAEAAAETPEADLSALLRAALRRLAPGGAA